MLVIGFCVWMWESDDTPAEKAATLLFGGLFVLGALAIRFLP